VGADKDVVFILRDRHVTVLKIFSPAI